MNFTAFIDSLKYMGIGMIGIFIIISIIVIMIGLFMKMFPASKETGIKG